MIGENIITQGFKRFSHRALDLRSVNKDNWEKLSIHLPEKCVFLRDKFQRKWGQTLVFRTVKTNKIIKFTHLFPKHFIVDEIYEEGAEIGFSATTEYMRENGKGEHIHFAVFNIKKNGKEGKSFNPTKYFDLIGEKYGWK